MFLNIPLLSFFSHFKACILVLTLSTGYMMKEEGALRPMRGATVVISGSGPAHALYFTWYEQMKKVLAQPRFSRVPEHLGYGFAGATATLFHDAIMTPAEAVKQRMQMCCSKHTRW